MAVQNVGTETTRRAVALLVVVAAMAVGVLAWQPAPAQAAQTSLVGLFRLQAGGWSGGASGTYFRMLQNDGSTYLANTNSTAGDKTYTLLSPGTDGGLRTGVYQPTPNPAFASNGDALSGKVTAPTYFFGVKFATATNQVDPQTSHSTSIPTIYVSGTSLSGNLSAFAASWNKQNFNQGSPKPDGSSPGFTKPASGTYNPSTRGFTLTWRSLIVGGPFNNFTGEWHLAGTFVPANSAPAPTPTPGHSTPTHHTSAPAPSANGSTSGSPKATASHAKTSATASRTKSAASAGASGSGVGTLGTSTPADPQTSPVAGQAKPKSKSSDAGWFIGGAVLLVVVLGSGAFWLIRTRAARG